MARIRSWTLIQELERRDYRIFQLRKVEVADPRDGTRYPRVVLEATDWVNVIAVTAANEVVLVRQFRFGSWSPTLEIPGGMVDGDEEPLFAARRELEEETGYRAAEMIFLGASRPNPAIINNRLHTFLALGCVQVHGGAPEASEDISVELVPREKIPELMRSGEIDHSLVLAAFQLEALRAP